MVRCAAAECRNDQQRWPAAGTRPPGPRQPYNPTEWVEMTVTLLRQDSGFGFRIVGGTEEGSQVKRQSQGFYLLSGQISDIRDK